MKKSVKIALIIAAAVLTGAIVVGAVILFTPQRMSPFLNCIYEPDTYVLYEGEKVDAIRPYITVYYCDSKGNSTEIDDYSLSLANDNGQDVFVEGDNFVRITYLKGKSLIQKDFLFYANAIPQYSVSFIANGSIVDIQRFTMDNIHITEPAVPFQYGYNGQWEEYSLQFRNITVNAIYTPKTYNVMLDYNGATVCGDEFANVTYSEVITSLPTPGRAGYRFEGWSYYGNILSNGDTWYGDDDNPVFVAQWSPEYYEVTFNADGQTVSVQTYTVENTNITEPRVPSKQGYTAQWEQYSLAAGGNITVNAIYTPITYTVTFKADGNVIASFNYTVENANDIVEPTVPAKIGYTGSWPSYTLTTGNRNISAVYKAKQYTLSLNYDGATGGNTQQTLTTTYNQKVWNLPEPTKTGYRFGGWYYGSKLITSSTKWLYDVEEAELVAKWSKDTYTVTFVVDGITYGRETYTVENPNITEPSVPVKEGYTGEWEDYTLTTGDITVNAIYTVKQYIVTLNYDGATGGNAQQTITVTYNQPVGTLPAPTKTGYNFIGWYYNGNIVTQSTVWNYDVTSAELTAEWSKDSYTVTFVADGQTVSVQTYTVENTNITEPSVPVKEGYTGEWEEYTLTTGNITVNAVYTPVVYTVKFVAAGKTVSTQTYSVENKNIVVPGVPSKAGYTGVWEDYTLTTGDITVNAIYTAKQYTVTLDYNGATGGNAQQTITVTYNQPVGTLPAPTKTGYGFIRWEYNGLIIDSTTIWTKDTDETLVFDAHYSINHYIVTFVADGQTVSVQTYSVENTTIIVPSVPAKAGYTGEWEEYTLTTGNITVNAIYTPVVYTVKFVADGTIVSTQTYTVENKNIVVPSVPSKTGYTGVWEDYSLTTGNVTVNAIYTPVVYTVTFVIDGNTVSTQTYTVENKNIVTPEIPSKTGYTAAWTQYTLTTGNRTVNAIYTAKQYTVTLDYNGATGGNTVKTVTVTYNKPIGTLPAPTKTGYAFANWKYNNNVVDSSTVWTTDTTEPITFTAQFNLRYYTVTFNSNGGTVVSGKTVGYGSKITEPATPTKTGAEFLGWYRDSNFNTKWNFATDSITSNVTLYAKWTYLIFTLNSDNASYTVKSSSTAQNETSIIIPSEYNGKPVTTIGYRAFYGCNKLTSITIPDSVTAIGSYAFHNCSNLTSITIPDGVTSIESDAFYNCSKLQYNEYNNSKYLGNASNPYLALIKAKSTTITTCTINSNTKVIADSAFSDCDLTSITIPNSVTSIGKNAFEFCRGLTSITVSPSNTKYHSAGNCLIETSTKTLILGCSTSVIPTDGSVTSIGYYAFSGCSNLTSITIPDRVTLIDYGAFYRCSNLTSITIPDRVTLIDSGAFSNCSNLTSITISDSVTKIGTEAFYGCSKLTSVTVGKGVTSIDRYAFSGCSNLNTIKYKGTVLEWQVIPKYQNWNTNVPATKVICSDGEVAL